MAWGWLSKIFAKPGGTASVPSPAPIGAPSSPTAPPPSAPTPAYPQTHRRTPNISPGRIIRPTHILLHHTGGAYAGSVAWCLNPASKVSYHCIIARTGKRTILAQPTQRTWHAGVSSWQGRPNCNNYSIGLAWEGDTYEASLSEDAIASAAEYLRPLLKEYGIPLKNIIRHGDVTSRKNDCSPFARFQLIDALKAT